MFAKVTNDINFFHHLHIYIFNVTHVVFEEQTATSKRSGSHPYPNLGKDFQTVLQVLREEEVFVSTSERHHKTFNFTRHLLAKLSHHELQVNIKKNIDQVYVPRPH